MNETMYYLIQLEVEKRDDLKEAERYTELAIQQARVEMCFDLLEGTGELDSFIRWLDEKEQEE